ncbi:IclR family transcriptional regulator [Pseudomonas duriflava]|uniref:IclR family transcriptional regulator n=1 Tax=Pseudomonas duriflava TaxID=459528 RepID=A0A562Q6T1_9PSED|nr:IclR family transcriptional regulator [Pseudomonas duriflava]TWI52475.1 IclR family transcriptional regulator [Pseudomonas duriflava]
MTTVDLDRGGIQVISRAAAILRCLENEPAGLSLGAIAKRIDLPRSTVQRLVDALALEQLLEVHGAGGVRLGPALIRLASRSHGDITQRAKPFLEALSTRTGETAILVHAHGAELMALHVAISNQELRVAPVPGNFLAIHATSGGKILLAGMSDRAVTQLLNEPLRSLTPNTHTALLPLLEELRQVRQEGFAYDREEHMIGVRAIATGIETPHGHYAISLAGPAFRIVAAQDELRAALDECRNALADALRSQG